MLTDTFLIFSFMLFPTVSLSIIAVIALTVIASGQSKGKDVLNILKQFLDSIPAKNSKKQKEQLKVLNKNQDES